MKTFRLAAGLFIGAALHAQGPTLDINVRTTVELPKGQSLGEHPTFIMAPATEVVSPERLVRPVPEATLLAIYRLLQQKLEAQGYVGVPDKTRPEILITIQYGRGYLPNPYTIGATTSMGAPGSVTSLGERSGGPPGMTGDTGPSVSVSGVNVDVFKHFEANYESKAQLAAQEKLFFTIAAWKFASMEKGAKPIRYWTTTVLVDDPDHRDLNGLYEQMLTAGAEFFNRRINKAEVEVSTQIREGKVQVGIPRVVEPKK